MTNNKTLVPASYRNKQPQTNRDRQTKTDELYHIKIQ